MYVIVLIHLVLKIGTKPTNFGDSSCDEPVILKYEFHSAIEYFSYGTSKAV